MDCSTYHSTPATPQVYVLLPWLLRVWWGPYMLSLEKGGGGGGGRKREGKICKSLLRGCTTWNPRTADDSETDRALVRHRPHTRSGAGSGPDLFRSPPAAWAGNHTTKVFLSNRQCWVGVSGDSPSKRTSFFSGPTGAHMLSLFCFFFFYIHFMQHR